MAFSHQLSAFPHRPALLSLLSRHGGGDGFPPAGDEDAGSDAVDGLTSDDALFHGHAEIEAELVQEFEEDVLLAAIALEVIHGGF